MRVEGECRGSSNEGEDRGSSGEPTLTPAVTATPLTSTMRSPSSIDPERTAGRLASSWFTMQPLRPRPSSPSRPRRSVTLSRTSSAPSSSASDCSRSSLLASAASPDELPRFPLRLRALLLPLGEPFGLGSAERPPFERCLLSASAAMLTLSSVRSERIAASLV